MNYFWELKLIRDSIVKLSKEKRITTQGLNKLELAKGIRVHF